MIRWFAKNDIATNLIMLGIVLTGFFICLPSMPVEINPAYPYKQVNVFFKISGNTAEDIERSVSIPLESKLNGISGIKAVYSRVSYGKVYFEIKIKDSANLQDMKADIETAVNDLPSLPQGSQTPSVWVPDPTKWQEVISVMVTGDLADKVLLDTARQVRDDLITTPGISYAKVLGSTGRRIYIEPSLESLRTHDLSIREIADAINDSSVDLTAGRIASQSRGFQVSAKNQAFTKEEFGNIKIRNIDGAELRVKDVASILDSVEDDQKITMCNGRPCVSVEVMRLAHENALTVADKVKEYVNENTDKFPEALELVVWDDQSVSLRSRIKILKENMLQGAILIIIALSIFLRPSLAFFVVMGVPISFAGGLIIMNFLEVSINMWTLFGFITVLGIVVDDAIVTAENIHETLEKNTNRLDAVVEGTKQVATPVTFGVITTMVAFIPLMFLSGHVGNIARQLPLVIIPVLIFSLIESKFILPGHLKHRYSSLSKINPFPTIQRFVNRALGLLIAHIYTPLVRFCVSFRWAVVATFIAILATTIGYISGPQFKLDTFPAVERNILEMNLEMQADTEIHETHEVILRIAALKEQLAEEFPDGKTGKSLIRNIFHTTGGRIWSNKSTPNAGFIYLEITPPSERDPETKDEDMISGDQIAERWRELIGEVPGANRVRVQSLKNVSRGLSEQLQIEFEIRGVNEEAKKRVAQEAKEWIKQQTWASFASYEAGKPTRQINFKVNANGAAAGLTDRALAAQVRAQILGTDVQQFQDGEDEVLVNVRLPDDIRENPHALNALRIKTQDGESSFKSVATLEETYAAPFIRRVDRSRVFTIKAGTTHEQKAFLSQHVASISQKMDELCTSHPGASWRFIGKISKDRETKRALNIGMAALMFTLFALLAIPFKSIVQPFFVMLAVPLGIVGGLLGHYHMGVTASYLSIFGVLALAGVVVNDSLVIVDYINQKKSENSDLKTVVIQAGIRRFRPILLTSITTFAGLYPIMMESSVEAAFLRPMAIALGFGILYATLITLILIPCAYMVSEDLKLYLRWFFTGKKTSPE